MKKNIFRIIVVIITVLSLSIIISADSFPASYSMRFFNKNGYYNSTIFIKNGLSSTYSSLFNTCVSTWNNQSINGRKYTVNTTSSSEIFNLDFRTSSIPVIYDNYDWAEGIHESISLNNNLVHQTTWFFIYINDYLIEMPGIVSTNDTYKKAVMMHELGHPLGLADINDMSDTHLLMSYKRNRGLLCDPNVDDAKHVRECWNWDGLGW